MSVTENRYSGELGRSYHATKHAASPECADFIAQLRATKLQQFIKPADVVLEFGAGPGWNLRHLICARKLAVDLVNVIDPHVQVDRFANSLDSFEDESVDVVVFHHVLEHLRDPSASLASAAKKLRFGGRLILHVPLESRRYQRWPSMNDSDHHLFAWTPRTLSNLVQDHGYEVRQLSVKKYGYERRAFTVAESMHLGRWAAMAIRTVLGAVRPAEEIELVAMRRK
jgi:predicted SAM-dependent methyltransferase